MQTISPENTPIDRLPSGFGDCSPVRRDWILPCAFSVVTAIALAEFFFLMGAVQLLCRP